MESEKKQKEIGPRQFFSISKHFKLHDSLDSRLVPHQEGLPRRHRCPCSKDSIRGLGPGAGDSMATECGTR